MITQKEILARLRSIREEKGLRQDALAKTLGIDRTTYLRKERGLIPITTEEWLGLAGALGVEPVSFFLRSEPLNSAEKEKLLTELLRRLTPEELRSVISAMEASLKDTIAEDLRLILAALSKNA